MATTQKGWFLRSSRASFSLTSVWALPQVVEHILFLPFFFYLCIIDVCDLLFITRDQPPLKIARFSCVSVDSDGNRYDWLHPPEPVPVEPKHRSQLSSNNLQLFDDINLVFRRYFVCWSYSPFTIALSMSDQPLWGMIFTSRSQTASWA